MDFVVRRYGRMLEDFEVGAVYAHPWDVTVDGGMIAFCQASFLDASPVFASARLARDLGFRDRPLHPVLLLNLGLSFSVQDVSEMAIAHLAYIDVRFPAAAYAGDTLAASSKVLGVKRASSGDRGVVHVRTSLVNQTGEVVCTFERKALVRAGGKLEGRWDAPLPVSGRSFAGAAAGEPAPVEHRLPSELRSVIRSPSRHETFAGFAEDFVPGQILAHGAGRTVSEAEHMQLTTLFRNTHPLHFDEVYCKAGASFAGTRVVYGGLVFGWVTALASRDTCGNAIWDMGFDAGAHPNGVVAGDTLFAATKVLAVEPHDAASSRVKTRLVGVKNEPPSALLAAGADLFASELDKEPAAKIKAKVFEIDRTVLVRRRKA
jgi:2-methylfumaryl-CoA hydratase